MADFEAIYREHFQNVYKYVLSLCRSESLAEEITQETFYKALNSIDRFKGNCQLYVWLCQIAKNTYFTYAQKQKRYAAEADAVEPDLMAGNELEPEAGYLGKETLQRLHVLLHQLKEPYREVFTLRVFCELPFSQIGELFGKTDSWARLIFYRAKLELRRKFDENDL